MILIVDSGSTKCDWIVINNQGNQVREKITTKGLNPAILKKKKLRKIIKKTDDLMEVKAEITHVFFYGAGCGTEKPRRTLQDIIQSIFLNAEVEVKEDTMAAVRATINSKNEAAIVCILGTGSNCSYFDGKKLHQRIDSLGYSLMDDASGNYFGKQLIRDYYFNHMPTDLKVLFSKAYNIEADFIKSNLYKKPNPNAYLASFAEFMFSNKDAKYITDLIKSGMHVFSKNMILQFKDVLKEVPVHFAGSIAFLCKDEILEVSKEIGFTVGNFAKRPIEGLVKYHIDNL